ncbi:MAG: efflux RND transporter periplasmic adaptor subunit [Deltaproteobacteria bacterium]|nr:efflux RND transporter periplasmic adaptor subunit [Deltaproteobacteria bacterium]
MQELKRPTISEILRSENVWKKFSVKLFMVITFFALAGFSIVFLLINAKTAKKEEFLLGKVERGDLTVTVTATGTIEPKNKVDVGSELSGIIKSVEVDYNSPVKQGQILAKLDTSKLEAQISQAKASLEMAKAKLLEVKATVKETETRLTQLKKLWEISNGKMPSKAEIDAAEAAFLRAKAEEAAQEAQIYQAQAILNAYETDLSKSVIRSPISGIVLEKNVEAGQVVAASFQSPVLFTIAYDLKEMELHVDVDEADIGKIKEGQKVRFTVSAYPERVYEGRVTQVRFASKEKSGVITYGVIISVKNTDLSLRPGMTATADIIVKQIKNSILLPNAALRFVPKFKEDDSRNETGLLSKLIPRPPKFDQPSVAPEGNKSERKVYLLKNGRPFEVSIRTGETDGNVTEVLSTNLEPGTYVIVGVTERKK